MEDGRRLIIVVFSQYSNTLDWLLRLTFENKILKSSFSFTFELFDEGITQPYFYADRVVNKVYENLPLLTQLFWWSHLLFRVLVPQSTIRELITGKKIYTIKSLICPLCYSIFLSHLYPSIDGTALYGFHSRSLASCIYNLNSRWRLSNTHVHANKTPSCNTVLTALLFVFISSQLRGSGYSFSSFPELETLRKGNMSWFVSVLKSSLDNKKDI